MSVLLKSSDEKVFSVDREIALMSLTIQNLVEGKCCCCCALTEWQIWEISAALQYPFQT